VLSYVHKPLMTVSALIGLKCLCVEKKQTSFIKKPIIPSIFHYNIIIPNMSTCFFHCSFLHQTHHYIHHLCVSQFSTLRAAVPCNFLQLNKNISSTQFCIQYCCAAEKQWHCTVLTVWKSHSHRSQWIAA